MTTGPGAVQDLDVVLTGIARTPSQNSALVSINGKAAEWIVQGQTKDDVTLTDVQAGKITVDTPTGTKDVVLGQKGAAVAGAAPGTAPTLGTEDHPPAGVRLPPAPASAPAA